MSVRISWRARCLLGGAVLLIAGVAQARQGAVAGRFDATPEATPPQAAGEHCSSIPGVSMAADRARFLVFGELHGTLEIPAFLADVVCKMSSNKPLIIALEFTAVDGAAINSYLHSAAVEDPPAFLRAGDWAQPPRDGRTSEAMLEMIRKFRRLIQGGRDLTVAGILPPPLSASLSQDYYELQLANQLARLPFLNTDAKIVVLVGEVHARKFPLPRVDPRPAASLLPPAEVIALKISPTGGSAWTCQAGACGSHAVAADDKLPRGIVLDAQRYAGYDGYFSVGREYSASRPAGLR